MKRKKWLWVLLAAAAVLCVVILCKPVYRSAPDLLIKSVEEELTVPGSAIGWEYKQSGRWVSYESSLKPVEPRGDYPKLESTGGTVRLEFPVEPDQLWVSRYWDSRAEKDEDGLEVSWRPDGNELELKPGNYLYEITASWRTDGRKWGGNAVYYFRAIGPVK